MTTRNRGRRNTNERGGSRDRRARKLWLLAKHGRAVAGHWIAQCWECSTLVTYATMIVDRITPGEHGGRYTRDNIRIHCPRCSCTQGACRTNQLRKVPV